MLLMENGPDTALTNCAEVNPFVYTELGKSLYFAVATNVFHTTVQDFCFFMSGLKDNSLQPSSTC